MSESPLAAQAISRMLATLTPDRKRIERDVEDFRRAHPHWGREKIASKWADRACWIYAGQGAASALPGAIPGPGTAAQIAIEGGAISADLALMIRLMSGMTMGVGLIYERDIESDFNTEFVRVMGLWCGTLVMGREAAVRVGTKVAAAQFNRRVPAEVFKRINRRVGATIVSKCSTRRGAIAVGRLVPMGVGAAIGGGFNLASMKGFKKAAIHYFQTEEPQVFVEITSEVALAEADPAQQGVDE